MTSPLDDLIAAERQAPPEAPALQTKRTWKRLNKSLAIGAAAPFDLPPPGAAATAAGATGTKAAMMSGTAKVLLAAVIGGTATLSTVAALTSEAPRHNEPPRVAPVATATAPVPDDEPAAVHIASPEPRLEPEPEPEPEPELVPDPAAADEPDVVIQDDPAPERTAKPKPVPSAPKGLTAELEVVGQASRAVNAGRYNEALAVLRKHAKRFADGALLEDRLALRAIALCGAGKLESGSNAATRFAKTYPRSVHATRVREACKLTP